MATEKKFLNAAEILGANDIKVEQVEVKEWGGWVRVRTLTGEEANRFTEASEKKQDESNALLVSMSVVDEDGNNLFTEHDVEALKKKSLKAILTINKFVLKMNGLEREGQDKIKKD